MGDELRVLTFNGGLCGEIRSSECANSEKMSKMVDSCCWANVTGRLRNGAISVDNPLSSMRLLWDTDNLRLTECLAYTRPAGIS